MLLCLPISKRCLSKKPRPHSRDLTSQREVPSSSFVCFHRRTHTQSMMFVLVRSSAFLAMQVLKRANVSSSLRSGKVIGHVGV